MKKNLITLLLLTFVFSGYCQDKDIFGHTKSQPFNSIYANAEYSKAGNPWVSIGPFGGDVVDLAINPTSIDYQFAAVGIPYYRIGTDDTWKIVEGLQAMLSSGNIESFEFNSNGRLFAGGAYGYGKVYLSDDNGESWMQKNLPFNSGVLDIEVDPQNPDNVFIGMSGVLGIAQNKVIIKSTDGGDSWTAIDVTSVLPVGWACVDIAVDPDDSNHILAVGNESFSNAVIIRSTDGGDNWQIVSNGLPAGKPFNSVTVANDVIYVCGGQLFGGNFMGVYKSENNGTSWQNISSSFPNKVANDLIVNPNDPNRICIATEGDGVYYTVNGGITWNYNTSGAGDAGSVRHLYYLPGDPMTVFAGYLGLGVCISEDGGGNWYSSSTGIASLTLNDIEVDPTDPDNMIVAFEGENSGGCYMTNNVENWELIEGLPTTRFSAVSVSIDGTYYAWSNGPTTIAQEGLYKSTDGGATWTNTGPFVGSVFETEIWTIEMSKTDPNIIFIGGNNFGANGWASMIYKTEDAGGSWINVFMGPSYDSFKDIHIVGGTNDQTVYAAYKSDNTGGFIKSIDGGNNWLPVNDGLPTTAKWAGAITSSPMNPDILFGGIGGYGGVPGTVYKSENAGSSWEATNLSLLNYSKITDFACHPGYEGLVYLSSTLNGVYLTMDGMNWETANDDLPSTNITGFAEVYSSGFESFILCCSSFGNSAFFTDMVNGTSTRVANQLPDEHKIKVYPNPSNGIMIVSYPEDLKKIIQLRIYDLRGKTIDFQYALTDNTIKIWGVENRGIYTLVLQGVDASVTKKIIVK